MLVPGAFLPENVRNKLLNSSTNSDLKHKRVEILQCNGRISFNKNVHIDFLSSSQHFDTKKRRTICDATRTQCRYFGMLACLLKYQALFLKVTNLRPKF